MSPCFRRLIVLVACALLSHTPTLAAQTATATTLSILSGSTPVTSVTPGTVITLTAAVSGGASPITGGTIYFCDSIVKNCMLMPTATAQVVNGTATAKTVLAPGSYSFTAVYMPATGFSSSTSPASTLSIATSSPTTTTLTNNGSYGGSYELGTAVSAQTLIAPTGTITIKDTTAGTVLATGTLTKNAQLNVTLNQASQQAVDSRGACTTVAGDFNSDGYPDIAIGSGCKSPNDGLNSATALQILLNNGNGTFTAGPPVPVAMTNTNVIALTVGDFNNDGTLDLVASDKTAAGVSHTYLLTNNGTGTFTATQVSTSCLTSQLVTADFNRDGNLDFAAACGVPIVVFLGSGTGTFTQNQTNITDGMNGASQNQFAVADFTQDGYPDIVGIIYDNGIFQADLFTNSGDGKTFTASYAATVPFPIGIVAGDFDGDGRADIFAFGQMFDASYLPIQTTTHFVSGGYGSDTPGIAPIAYT
ncbi:MAG: FG-GAP-like repeat-containing protein, partial [Terriglobus sp.]